MAIRRQGRYLFDDTPEDKEVVSSMTQHLTPFSLNRNLPWQIYATRPKRFPSHFDMVPPPESASMGSSCMAGAPVVTDVAAGAAGISCSRRNRCSHAAARATDARRRHSPQLTPPH